MHNDTFTYATSDGQTTSNVATVTIRVGVEDILADLTGNGFVDFEDLTILLANWNQNVSAAEPRQHFAARIAAATQTHTNRRWAVCKPPRLTGLTLGARQARTRRLFLERC
ncbi:MAG: hypothetical protein IID44_27190 [Planctomycetes bacterium]|nr:hypothetical protein [Planctomycetota bacterium]